MGTLFRFALPSSKFGSKRDLCLFFFWGRGMKKMTGLLPLMLSFLPFLYPEVTWSSKWIVLFSPFAFLLTPWNFWERNLQVSHLCWDGQTWDTICCNNTWSLFKNFVLYPLLVWEKWKLWGNGEVSPKHLYICLGESPAVDGILHCTLSALPLSFLEEDFFFA